ncbi:MAG: HU family DNA-binding protein [Erysipelotrichaceae bacterium]
MNKVNKQDIIREFSIINDISITQASKYIESLFDVLANTLKTADEIDLRGLGKFKKTIVEPKEVINNFTKEKIVSKRKTKVTIKPYTTFIEKVEKE